MCLKMPIKDTRKQINTKKKKRQFESEACEQPWKREHFLVAEKTPDLQCQHTSCISFCHSGCFSLHIRPSKTGRSQPVDHLTETRELIMDIDVEKDGSGTGKKQQPLPCPRASWIHRSAAQATKCTHTTTCLAKSWKRNPCEACYLEWLLITLKQAQAKLSQ